MQYRYPHSFSQLLSRPRPINGPLSITCNQCLCSCTSFQHVKSSPAWCCANLKPICNQHAPQQRCVRQHCTCLAWQRDRYQHGLSACRDTYITAEPGESPNDRNDRAIRVAAAWYDARLPPAMPIVFLTNDADNRRKAQEAGLRAMTVQVRKVQGP